MLVLPPLFAFVKADYGITYTEVGLALTVFNTVSAVAQTPAGFLIDRINARFALIAGLVLGAAGFAIAATVNSYWVLIAAFAVLGLGNTVYHPADYALLSTARCTGAHELRLFGAHLRRHARHGRRARRRAVHAPTVWHARRVSRLRGARPDRRACAGVHARRRRGSSSAEQARAARGADRLAGAADGADPDELPVLPDLRVRQLRHPELLGGGGRPALRHQPRPPPTPRCPAISC